MSQDLKKEVNDLMRDLRFGFQITRPTEQFCADMILASVQLHIIADKVKNSQELGERRKLIHEYDRQGESIRKGLQMLYESARPRETARASCATLP